MAGETIREVYGKCKRVRSTITIVRNCQMDGGRLASRDAQGEGRSPSRMAIAVVKLHVDNSSLDRQSEPHPSASFEDTPDIDACGSVCEQMG